MTNSSSQQRLPKLQTENRNSTTKKNSLLNSSNSLTKKRRGEHERNWRWPANSKSRRLDLWRVYALCVAANAACSTDLPDGLPTDAAKSLSTKSTYCYP